MFPLPDTELIAGGHINYLHIVAGTRLEAHGGKGLLQLCECSIVMKLTFEEDTFSHPKKKLEHPVLRTIVSVHRMMEEREL